MTAPQASTVSTEGLAATGAPVVLAQATVTPLGTPGISAGASAAPAAVASPSVGTLSNATPGVAVMREGVRIPVDGNQTLMAGDRVIVPDGGQANVLFPDRPPTRRRWPASSPAAPMRPSARPSCPAASNK